MARARPLTLLGLPAAVLFCAPALAGPLPLPAGHRATEAHVAIDPTDPRDVLVVARDEDDDPRLALRMWRSSDGGRSFRTAMLVDERLDGAPADASDPVALFDHEGRPSPAFLALRYGESSWDSRIVVGDRVVVRDVHGPPFPSLGEGFGSRRWHDKPWAAIDPRDGSAHVAWTMQGATDTGPVREVAVASAPPGAPFPAPQILGSGSGAQIVAGPGPAVLVVWFDLPNLSRRARILSARSVDGGVTWSPPAVVAADVPAGGEPPFPTVVRAGSGYVACWQEHRSALRSSVACSRSPEGVAWSATRTIGGGGSGATAQPALAAGPGRRLWLAFYRFSRRSTRVELWRSHRGTSRWLRRRVLTRRAVPRSGSHFLGDYQGLAAGRKRVIAAFVMPVRAAGFRQVVVVTRTPVRR